MHRSQKNVMVALFLSEIIVDNIGGSGDVVQ